MRGAARSRDGLGRPILAMPSTTAKGESKICAFTKQGGITFLVSTFSVTIRVVF